MDQFSKSTATGSDADFCGYRLPCGYCRALEKHCLLRNAQTYSICVTGEQCGSTSSVTMKDYPSATTISAQNGGGE